MTSDTRLVTEERTSKLRSEATESACDRERAKRTATSRAQKSELFYQRYETRNRKRDQEKRREERRERERVWVAFVALTDIKSMHVR